MLYIYIYRNFLSYLSLKENLKEQIQTSSLYQVLTIMYVNKLTLFLQIQWIV